MLLRFTGENILVWSIGLKNFTGEKENIDMSIGLKNSDMSIAYQHVT